MDKEKEISKEEAVKEAVEEAKKAAQECGGECQDTDQTSEEGVCDDQEDNAQEDTPDTVEEENAGDEKKSRLFGRKNKKDKKDEKIEELTDKVTRQMAEFDNFRKRTDKEKSQMYEIGAKDVIEKILPVVDNFERGLQAVPEDKRDDPFVSGMEKIYKQMMTALEEIGVKPIEAVGQEFNPDYHNAVMHVEDEEQGDNTVAEEFQKGYMYRETVVRHSMVKVAN